MAFGGPEVFSVPTCLLGGPFVVVVANGSNAVCAVRDPGVEIPEIWCFGLGCWRSHGV